MKIKVSNGLHDLDRIYMHYYRRFEPIMQKYLSVTTETIVNNLGKSCISIYMIGSFGRMEGAIYIENDSVQPIRDFDILIITTKPVSSHIIRTTTEEIHERLGLSSPTKAILEEFSIWITYVPIYELLRGTPLLKYYELKVASKHLCGIDIRSIINLNLKDLSLYNGILILFTKVHSLLSLYPFHSRTYKRTLNYIYEVLKTYTEIPTIFSLLDNSIYRPSFSGRCIAFLESCSARLPKLIFRIVPNLDSYILFACKRRKLLDRTLIDDFDLNSSSTHVLETLDKIISLYIICGYGIITPLSGFSRSNSKILNKVGIVTLAGFFSDYLKKVVMVRCDPLAKFLSFILLTFYIPLSNVKFFIKARKEKIPVKLRLIFSIKNHFVYLTYIGINLLKALVRGYTNVNPNLFKEYLSCSYIKDLEKNKNSFVKISIILKLVVRLLRLADISLHEKTF